MIRGDDEAASVTEIHVCMWQELHYKQWKRVTFFLTGFNTSTSKNMLLYRRLPARNHCVSTKIPPRASLPLLRVWTGGNVRMPE